MNLRQQTTKTERIISKIFDKHRIDKDHFIMKSKENEVRKMARRLAQKENVPVRYVFKVLGYE